VLVIEIDSGPAGSSPVPQGHVQENLDRHRARSSPDGQDHAVIASAGPAADLACTFLVRRELVQSYENALANAEEGFACLASYAAQELGQVEAER
jgi:hypothetical protein